MVDVRVRYVVDAETLATAMELAEGRLVVLVFYAQWVKACTPLVEAIEKASPDMPEVAFILCNLDLEDIDVVFKEKTEGIDGAIPTLIFYRNGTQVGFVSTGDTDWDKAQDLIKEMLTK